MPLAVHTGIPDEEASVVTRDVRHKGCESRRASESVATTIPTGSTVGVTYAPVADNKSFYQLDSV